MTDRIRNFLRNRADDGPVLVVDLEVVRDNYAAFAKALPDSRVFYAVKANPAPEVLSLLGAHQAAPDPGRHDHRHEVVAVPGGADPPLAQRQRLSIPGDAHLQTQRVGEVSPNGEATPHRQVDRGDHLAGGEEGPGGADADPGRAVRTSAGRQRHADQPVGQLR